MTSVVQMVMIIISDTTAFLVIMNNIDMYVEYLKRKELFWRGKALQNGLRYQNQLEDKILTNELLQKSDSI